MHRTTGRRPQTRSPLDQEVRLPQNSRSHPLDRPSAPQRDQVHVIIDHRSTDPQNQTSLRPPPQTTGPGPKYDGPQLHFPSAKGEKGRVCVSSGVPDTPHHPVHQKLQLNTNDLMSTPSVVSQDVVRMPTKIDFQNSWKHFSR